MNWNTIEYQRVDSTNAEARRLIAKGKGAGLVVTAEDQLSGRGRNGREWWNLPGKSILASFVFENMESSEATRLVSTSVVAAIRSSRSRGPLIKWPNDLVYQKKKAGGILSESFNDNGINYTVVGLGLNLNYTKRQLVMGRCLSATSLQIEEGRSWDAGLLLENIQSEMESRYPGDKDKNLSEYRDNLAFLGRNISLLTEGRRSKGIFTGVDDNGFLLLETGKGIERFPAGEVRKVRI